MMVFRVWRGGLGGEVVVHKGMEVSRTAAGCLRPQLVSVDLGASYT